MSTPPTPPTDEMAEERPEPSISDEPRRESSRATDSGRSIGYRIMILVGAFAVWITPIVCGLIEECKLEIIKYRNDRRERFIGNLVNKILEQPEFSHAVRVHGSFAHVLDYISKNEDEFFSEHWEGYNTKIKNLLKGVAVAGLSLLSIAFFIYGVVSRWRENDDAGRRDFPSTVWLDRVHHLFGDTGLWAIGITGGFILLLGVAGALIDLRAGLVGISDARNFIEEALTPHVRVAINEWSDQNSPTELRFEEGPGLSSTTDDRYLIERGEHRRIRSLIRELGASAVAISGPRGAGKSTLLCSLAQHYDSRHDLFIALEAPSSYQPKEFVITLYRHLCECIKRVASGMADSTTRRLINRALTLLRLIAALLTFVILISQWTPIENWLRSYLIDYLVPNNGWQAVAYAALCLVIRALFGFLRPRRGKKGAAELVRRAIAEANRLRFLQNIAIENSGVFKASFGFDLGRKHTKQLLEQAASMPDLVQSYRSFAADAIEWWRQTAGQGEGNLVIVIDELDRITDVDAAERFINDVKGIFGIQHCTYLVTISEDALAQFERRMVGIRPALDSTFDEVVRLPILTFAQSREILARRLVGFPQAFIALCHALSGGIPRDLIRTARGLIDARQTTGQDHLVPLTYEIVHQEVARLKSGLIGRINTEASEPDSFALLGLLADPEWPKRGSTGLLQAAAELLPSENSSEPRKQISMQLGVALYYYATIVEIFETFEYQLSLEAHHFAERLAVARSIMPTSVDLAYVHVQRLRSDVGFRDVTKDGLEGTMAGN